ncbi:MAG: hypothetical protein ACRYFX_02205 [Janthinobacterium lividum]
MKFCYLLGVALAVSPLPARSVAAAPAPPDTLRGQARLTRIISADLCTKLTQESQTQNLGKLTTDESATLVTKLIHSVMVERKEEVDAFMEHASNTNPGIGRQIGRNALFQLGKNCPVAAPVVAQLQARITKPGTKPLDPERQLLSRFIVPAACQSLSQAIEAENAKGGLKRLDPAARQELVKKAVLTGATPHAPALRMQYGEQVLTDPQQRDELSRKIIALLPDECPIYMLLNDGEADDATSPPDAQPAPPASKRPAAGKKH